MDVAEVIVSVAFHWLPFLTEFITSLEKNYAQPYTHSKTENSNLHNRTRPHKT